MNEMRHARQDLAQGAEQPIDFESAFAEEEVKYSDYQAEDYFAFVVFWALIAVVFTQFFTRYVIGNSTTWTEEIARYLLIVLAFSGSAMAVRKGSHIMVEFFHAYLPGKTVAIINTLIALFNITFYVLLAWISWQLAGRTMGMMVSIDVPKKVIYYLVCGAFVLMALRALHVLLKRVFTTRLPEDDNEPA